MCRVRRCGSAAHGEHRSGGMAPAGPEAATRTPVRRRRARASRTGNGPGDCLRFSVPCRRLNPSLSPGWGSAGGVGTSGAISTHQPSHPSPDSDPSEVRDRARASRFGWPGCADPDPQPRQPGLRRRPAGACMFPAAAFLFPIVCHSTDQEVSISLDSEGIRCRFGAHEQAGAFGTQRRPRPQGLGCPGPCSSNQSRPGTPLNSPCQEVGFTCFFVGHRPCRFRSDDGSCSRTNA